MAASLQARVIAQMKIKEEDDERQKRTNISPMPIHNGNVTITPTAHIKTEGKILKILICLPISYSTIFFRSIFVLLLAVSSSLKRTSPIVHHRAAKIRPHYANHGMMSPSEQDRMRSNELMSPEINSMLPDDRAHVRPKHDDG